MGNNRADVGRLALRAEGQMWNAYYALSQTSMDGAILLGSIRLSFVTDNEARKQSFMRLMTGVVGDIIKDATGLKATWGSPRPGPEHERSGSA